MWTIYSTRWGILEASHAYPSATIDGAITAHDVTREGKPMWEKVYLFPQDLVAIVPPLEV